MTVIPEAAAFYLALNIHPEGWKFQVFIPSVGWMRLMKINGHYPYPQPGYRYRLVPKYD